jgi:hypothetical protein
MVPPETTVIPARSTLYDTQINIQAFVTNVYGGVDNLAWTWVHERGLTDAIPRNQVGLRKGHTAVRSSLSPEFQTYLLKLDGWFDYVVEYRDALAHRIPLYIPPGGVRTANVAAYNELALSMTEALNRRDPDEYWRLWEEQDRLLVFQPLMSHSASETTAYFAFHAQMIADFMTIEELGQKMLSELGRIV